jgi:glycosyltransferase involved in cell wall biosynthesis
MINGKTITVVLPAYKASKTLLRTCWEIPMDIVDNVVLVDDNSPDNTVEIARTMGIKHIIKHERNKGYGANQKTCYNRALELGSDIVVMLHPDYQYTPKLIHSICYVIANGLYDVVFASRILGKGAIKGGMPRYKYVCNRLLTMFQNVMMGQKLSEYHTGYRAFSRKVLETVDYGQNSDDFVFDNEMAAQIFYAGFEIAEITCPTKYFEEASSISFYRSLKYGFGVLRVATSYFLAKKIGMYVKYLKKVN